MATHSSAGALGPFWPAAGLVERRAGVGQQPPGVEVPGSLPERLRGAAGRRFEESRGLGRPALAEAELPEADLHPPEPDRGPLVLTLPAEDQIQEDRSGLVQVPLGAVVVARGGR